MEKLVQKGKRITELIKTITETEPLVSKCVKLEVAENKEIWHIHFTNLININIVPNEDNDLFIIQISFFLDLKPTVVYMLSAHLLGLLYADFEMRVDLGENFLYDDKNSMIWGEDAEIQFSSDMYDLVREEVEKEHYSKVRLEINEWKKEQVYH